MKLNSQKVEETVLAVLWLTLHDGCRVWRTVDFDALDRLHHRGLISDPKTRSRSVVLTDEGLAEAARLAEKLFS